MYPGFKLSFDHNSVRKNPFLIASFFWDCKHSLLEMDVNFKFGRSIGYGDSYLKFLFCHFQELILHAIVHDAIAAVRAECDKGPGYCYMVG